ncbi:hypothetical protein P167DRAFT_378849 [Morchella conica CCBAS932]|uniref:Uncharacterized protein n=1 Tax=Morchella conica CCBAS932 TaxID=1392247 RepID=A0A3N4KZ01_9PEZI|nr:hypothetical protein P167DRAFT_378849 [Morchella conica CCBAS932]
MVPMPRLFMQRGAALPIRIRVIRYLGSQPVQRRMNMTDSYDHNPQLEEAAAPAKGKPLSDHSFKLGDRVMDLIKDHGDFKAEVNKSIGELSTKMANGFADVHREFADVRREIGDVRREIGDVKHMVGLLRWQLGIMVTVLTGFFGVSTHWD